MAQRPSRSSRPVRRTTPSVSASPACPLAAEIAALRARMLECGSPGARLMIRHMESFDVALSVLREAQADFRPTDHDKRYAADRTTLRFAYCKTQQIMTTLVEQLHSIARAVEPFGLTEANTALPAEPVWLEAAYAARRRDARHEARLRRTDNAVQRRIRTRNGAQTTSAEATSRTGERTTLDR